MIGRPYEISRDETPTRRDPLRRAHRTGCGQALRSSAESEHDMKLRMISMSVLLAASLAACGGKARGSDPPGGGKPGASLYDRLGGKDAITAVVVDFVEQRVAKDARINAFFASADIARLEGHLADQICEAADGPCKYTGKDMKTVHAGMNVKDVDFQALVEDLKMSLDHFKVPAREQQELLGKLAPMRDDIVTAK
jgi:hemoglobin